jgi:DNA adenine methylase
LARELKGLAPAGGTYLEPYAGGAGAAIKLLASNTANRIHLNDADPRVFSAWWAILNEPDRFVELLQETDLSVDNWRVHKAVVEQADTARRFELGFATFFLNRTNRSGILRRSGPIGGYSQAGRWKIGARFYRKSMVDRVRWLASRADDISLSNEDGIAFIRRTAREVDQATALYFIDPPYVSAGSRLYMNQMGANDHRALATLLRERAVGHWIVTYDDCPLIREIYGTESIESLEVRYSLQKKRVEREVIIRPSARITH